jgi:beta-lactamase class D
VKKILLLALALSTLIWPGFSYAFMDDYFAGKHLTGTMVISSLNTHKRYVYNAARARQRYLPASTFKIINTLIALQERVITDENEIIKWDGVDKGLAEWNRDQCLKTAFPVSCVWFYQELARRIGDQTYREYLKRVNYGNRRTGNQIDTFWLDGDLRISALEQVEFLKKIYRREYPFGPKYYDTLQKVMVVDNSPDYVLRAKTGTTARIKEQVGWYVGSVETRNDVWFFACNLDIRQPSDAYYRKEATYAALRELRIIK